MSSPDAPAASSGPAPAPNVAAHRTVLLWVSGLALAVAGIMGYVLWATTGGLVNDGIWVGLDFHVYYMAAQVLRRGEDIYSAGLSPLYIYPPFLAALVVPLALLPVTAATIAWKILQNGCLLLAGALLVRLLPRGVRPLGAGLLLFGGLLVPLRDEVHYGESNSLVLVLIVAALWLLARQATPAPTGPPGVARPAAMAVAGVLLALAFSIKVLPILLILYFGGRGPRAVAAVATGAALLIQGALLVLTPTTGDYWLIHFPALFGEAYPYIDNQSLNAALSRALLPSIDSSLPSMQLFDGAAVRPALTWLANFAVLGVAGAALVAATRRPGLPPGPRRTVRLLQEAGLVLLTIHLVSGSTWMHHLVDLAVPITALLGGWWLGVAEPGARSGGPARFLPALGLIAAYGVLLRPPGDWAVTVGGWAPGVPAVAWLAGNAPLWVVLGCWGVLAWRVARGHEVGLGPARVAVPDHAAAGPVSVPTGGA